jgi:hypothetical protein
VNSNSRIDADPDVRAIARALGIKQARGLASAIRDAAVDRVESTFAVLGSEPRSLDELREVVHHDAGLHVVRITSNEDLAAAQRDFAPELRGLPKQLAFEFETDTEALVLRRTTKDRLSNSKYVALVDARGNRENRAWFGEWHETAHTLVPDPANNQVLRRTRRERPEPVEQVIDLIAGSIGFWAPIVKPVLVANLASGVDVLAAFEATRKELAPDASREASYRAFANMLSVPLIIMWVDYGCRAADRRAGGNPARSLALRAKTVIRSDLAMKRGLNVPVNFRIPSDSVITRATAGRLCTALVELSDLGHWRDSTGQTLRAGPVKITARGRWAAIEAA